MSEALVKLLEQDVNFQLSSSDVVRRVVPPEPSYSFKEREAKRARTHHAPKQICKRAEEGRAQTVPGVGQPYAPPLNPELAIGTTKCSPVECVRTVLERTHLLSLVWTNES